MAMTDEQIALAQQANQFIWVDGQQYMIKDTQPFNNVVMFGGKVFKRSELMERGYTVFTPSESAKISSGTAYDVAWAGRQAPGVAAGREPGAPIELGEAAPVVPVEQCQ